MECIKLTVTGLMNYAGDMYPIMDLARGSYDIADAMI